MRMYCGYFGSGKTLALTKKLADAHSRGDFIISNYPTTVSNVVVDNLNDFLQVLKEVYVLKSTGKELSDLFPGEKFGKKRFVTIALDEVGVYFTNTSYKQWENPEFAFLMDFILQCRKLRVEIYGTVQHPAFADVKLRRITETWKMYKRLAPFLPISKYKEVIISPDSPNIEEPLEEIGKGFQWLGLQHAYELYDTYKLVSKSEIPKEEQYYKLLLSKAKFPKYSGDSLKKLFARHFPTFIRIGKRLYRQFLSKLVAIKNWRNQRGEKAAR